MQYDTEWPILLSGLEGWIADQQIKGIEDQDSEAPMTDKKYRRQANRLLGELVYRRSQLEITDKLISDQHSGVVDK